MKSVEVKVNETLPTKHPLGRCVWSILWIMSFWRVLLESIFFWAFSKKANILQEFCVNHENPRNYELWNIYGSILRKLNYAKALDEQMYSNFNEAKIECSTRLMLLRNDLMNAWIWGVSYWVAHLLFHPLIK